MGSEAERTLWCGNLSDQVTEELLFELFLQAGPLENVKIPKDKEGRKRNYSFITFKHEVSVPFTIELMNGIRLFGRALRLQTRSGSSSSTPGMNRSGSFSSPQGIPGGAPQTPGQFPPPIHRSGTWPSLPQNQSTPNQFPGAGPFGRSGMLTPESDVPEQGNWNQNRDQSYHNRRNSLEYGNDNRNQNRRSSFDQGRNTNEEYRQGNSDRRQSRFDNGQASNGNANSGMAAEMQRQRLLQMQSNMMHMQPKQGYRNQNRGSNMPWQQQQGGHYRY